MSAVEKFESWAIVELFGYHLAGKVSKAEIGGAAFVRLDVPAVEGREAFTKFLGQASIYAITPVAEEIARKAAQRLVADPIPIYMPELRQIPSRAGPDDGYYDPEFEDDEDYLDDILGEDPPEDMQLHECERCGCTEVNACAGGCAWDLEAAADGRYICTACTVGSEAEDEGTEREAASRSSSRPGRSSTPRAGISKGGNPMIEDAFREAYNTARLLVILLAIGCFVLGVCVTLVLVRVL